MITESRWWHWSAAVIAVLMTALAIGNLIEEDGGAWFGKVAFATVLLCGASAVAVGFATRRRQPDRSRRFIAFGVLPGAAGVAFLWFPPAVLVGIIAVATSVSALVSAKAVAVEALE